MSVNVENINRMIAAIEAQAKPIHMSNFILKNASENECGTTACLAGWANLLRLGAVGNGHNEDDDAQLGDAGKAATWMGISEGQAHSLFFNYDADRLADEHRKDAAIKLLTKLRDTGRAYWSDIMRNYMDEDGYIKPEFRRY